MAFVVEHPGVIDRVHQAESWGQVVPRLTYITRVDEDGFLDGDAVRWAHDHPLVSDRDVQAFAAAAQALPLGAIKPMTRLLRTGTPDDSRIALAALRCRGCKVTRRPDAEGYGVVAPAVTFHLFSRRRNSPGPTMPEPSTLTLAALTAEVPGSSHPR
jgi:hypothetical protein